MKNIIATVIALVLGAHAPTHGPVQASAQDRTLSTADGTTYSDINFERVEPDGLYIEYAFPGGGIGMSKVKFSRLSREQQKQFGFSKYEARNYEAAVTQANEDAAQELMHRWEVERDARRQRDAENERAYPGRMAAISAENAARAMAFYRDSHSNLNPAGSLTCGAQFSTSHFSTQTSYMPASGDLFPNRGVFKTH